MTRWQTPMTLEPIRVFTWGLITGALLMAVLANYLLGRHH